MFFERKRSISIEMIDFQTDKFGNRIEALVERIYKNIETTVGITSGRVALNPEIEELSMLIKSRLGFGVKIITDKALAAVMPFYSQGHNIFLPKRFQGEVAAGYVDTQLAAVQSKNKSKGTVNTADATVGGIFAGVTVNLYIDFLQLKTAYRCTAAETTAIMLHELGHVFYAMEYSDRIDSTNQILANLAKSCMNKKTDKDVNYIFRELKSVNPKIQREEIDKLMSSDKTVASYNWFKFIIDITDSGTGTQVENGAYSQNSFEQMADNFANRFGYGRHIVTGLDKLIKSGWSPEKQRSAWLFFQILNILWVAAVVACLAISITSGFLFYTVIWGIFALGIISGSGESGRDYTYDKLKHRYIRVRNDLVESLKDPELDKKEVKNIVENIYIVDGLVKDTHEFNTLLDGFLNIFWSRDRNAGRSIREEQLLEELASNMLFTKAAELRLMA